jgi:hypothetical protein
MITNKCLRNSQKFYGLHIERMFVYQNKLHLMLDGDV